MAESKRLTGAHIVGGIFLAALCSLPFDAMIVNGVITDARMEQAFRAADARAAKRAHDRAIAETISAEPQPDASALISRATASGERTEPGNTTDQAEEWSEAPVFPQVGCREASVQKAINRAADLASISANKSPASAGLVNAGRDMGAKRPCHPCVTLGRDRGFACVSSGLGESPMPRTQGVRPERSPSVDLEAAGGDRSYEVTAYSHGCTLPRDGRERPPQRAANGRWPVADRTVAADTAVHPFGTEVLIEGVGYRTVGDRGHAIKGRRLDLFVDSCKEARRFGRRWLRVFPVPVETTKEAGE